MKQLIIKVVLVLIFISSVYFVIEFGGGAVRVSDTYVRPGYVGGAIAFGLIASSSLLGFIYLKFNKEHKNPDRT